MVLVLNARIQTHKYKTALYFQCQRTQVRKCACVRETETLSLSPPGQALVCPLCLDIAAYGVRKIVDELRSVIMDNIHCLLYWGSTSFSQHGLFWWNLWVEVWCEYINTPGIVESIVSILKHSANTIHMPLLKCSHLWFEARHTAHWATYRENFV